MFLQKFHFDVLQRKLNISDFDKNKFVSSPLFILITQPLFLFLSPYFSSLSISSPPAPFSLSPFSFYLNLSLSFSYRVNIILTESELDDEQELPLDIFIPRILRLKSCLY